jgi:hypothetical protein
MDAAGVTKGIAKELVTKAYGTKLPQRRNPGDNEE